MKATYEGFEAKQRGSSKMPPVGQYVAEIQGVRVDKSYSGDRDVIVCMIEIIEGEYKGRYHEVFEDNRERFGNDVKYNGVFTLTPPIPGDEPWVKSRWESNLFCVQESNPGYRWAWDENTLKGKKVGINVRENHFKGKDGNRVVTTEIGQFETVDDVRNGKCKDMTPRGKKKLDDEEKNGVVQDGEFKGIEYGEDVTGKVEVPF